MKTSSPLPALALAAACLLAACATTPNCTPAQCAADAEITSAVRNELADHPALQAWQLSVQTIDGIVYLRGNVDTNVEREDAERIARSVHGVVSVENSITLRNAAGQ